MSTTIQIDTRTNSLIKADGIITGIICDTIFSKAAANEIEQFQIIYRKTLEKVLQSQLVMGR